MRFYIIPKKFFKIRDKKEKVKFNSSKKKIWIISISSAIMLLSIAGWMIYAVNRVPSQSYAEGVGEYSLQADTKEQREAFFEQFGYTATEGYEQKIIVSCDSEAFKEYNKLQKSQGLDLYPYCGKTAQMYTMQIDNGDKEELFGVIIVYKGNVIGGHITDMGYPAELNTFMGD